MKGAFPRPRVAVRQLAAATRHRHVPSSLALFSTSKPLGQVHPRGEYYDILITNPIPYADVKSEGPPSTSVKPQPPKPATPEAKAPPAPATNKKTTTKASEIEATKKEAAERARVVFGSRLAGPVERANRLAEMRSQSKMIAGVMVPPKPEEPVNCCMSGCVDCVWDRFRDEMEAWASASAEASRRLKAQEGGVTASMDSTPKPSAPDAMSMDEDGGGSESNWSDLQEQPKLSKDFWNDDLYKSLPVGIREFMKQEKRMKLKHMENGTLGG